jgi:hypothetical protein
MADRGFRIVLTGKAQIRGHPERWDSFREFWQAIGVDPVRYRGMGRWRLDPYPSVDPK